MSDELKPLTPEEIREKTKGTKFEEFAKKNYPIKEDYEKKLKELYDRIESVLRKYCDLREEYYNIITLWIIGTWFHKSFNTYPYLFLNAMKSSGKSRLLNLMSHITWNGMVVISISEAVLFRTAQFRTFLIDEFETVANKEKLALRELLNSAYKKGGVVERAYKEKTKNRENIKIERFPTYCPIAMANINGMDNVLADRCISLTLERSGKHFITKLVEDFDINPEIEQIKQIVRTFSVGSVMSDVITEYIQTQKKWNLFIMYNNIHTLPALHTYTTQPPQQTLNLEEIDFFEEINKSNLEGRGLEIFFPLFILAKLCGVLPETIKTAKIIIEERKAEDVVENRDIALIDYLNKLPNKDEKEFYRLQSIYEGMKESEQDWITPEWCGRALKRMNIIIERRRLAHGREVRINFKKVEEKANQLIYKEIIPEEKVEVNETPEKEEIERGRNPDEDSLT